MKFIIFVSWCLLIVGIVSFILLYLPRIRFWFSSFRPQKKLENSKKNKIAVIIPARNESAIIEKLLINLKAQTYDKENFDVYVIVKEKKDATIEICKKYQVTAFANPAQTCKGDALDYCIKEIIYSKKPYDGYFIVDADCLLKDDCLEQVNNALASGADVVSCKKVVKNYFYGEAKDRTLSACCNGLIWTLMDDMGNRGKSDRGIITMTIGTGIYLSSALINEWGGWPYRSTMTEDMELMNDCYVKGIKTFYYSYAQIYVEEASSLAMTNKRRSRWLQGLIDAQKLYNARVNNIKRTENSKKDIRALRSLNVVFAYIGGLTAFSFAQAILSVWFLFWRDSLWIQTGILCLTAIGVIYLSFLIMTAIALFVDRKYIKLPLYKKIALLFVHPLFYMQYIPIIARAIFGKQKRRQWDAIERINSAIEQ